MRGKGVARHKSLHCSRLQLRRQCLWLLLRSRVGEGPCRGGRGRLCELGEFFLKVQMPACKEACEEGLNHSPKHTEREGEAVQA